MEKTLFDRVIELCQEKGISQRELQRRMDMSIGSLSKWKTSMPNPTLLKKVADYFDVTTDYLEGRTKYRNMEHMLQSFDQNLDLQKLTSDSKEIPYDYCIQTDEGIILIEGMNLPPKYIDPEVRKIAQTIDSNNQLKRIFTILEKMNADQLNTAYKMIDAFDKAVQGTVQDKK